MIFYVTIYILSNGNVYLHWLKSTKIKIKIKKILYQTILFLFKIIIIKEKKRFFVCDIILL